MMMMTRLRATKMKLVKGYKNTNDIMLAMALMGLASFASDLTMPISWNTCVEIGKQYTATVSSTMNMLGNFAGFVAPVVFGEILQDTGNLVTAFEIIPRIAMDFVTKHIEGVRNPLPDHKGWSPM